MDPATIRRLQRQREEALSRIGVGGRHARRHPVRRVLAALALAVVAAAAIVLGAALVGAARQPATCVATPATPTTLDPPRQPGEYLPTPAGVDPEEC
jgi:hypothetical protein